MVTMYQRIKQMQLNYRKTRNTVGIATLTTLLGEFDRTSTRKGNDVSVPTDEVVFKTITKFIENVKMTQNVAFCQTRAEELCILEMLMIFQPPKVTEAVLESTIVDFIKASGGEVTLKEIMPHLKEKFGTTFDGKLASAVARQELDKVSK